MEEAEKIKGEGIHQLIRQLQDDRTAIKIHLFGNGSEWLTIIIELNRSAEFCRDHLTTNFSSTDRF